MSDLAIEPRGSAEASAEHAEPELAVQARVVPAGPLAPYRFALSLGFAAAVSAGPVLDAVHAGGQGLDAALLRALGAAAVMWFPTGLINRLLAKGATTEASHPR